jgi:uncharacterized protein
MGANDSDRAATGISARLRRDLTAALRARDHEAVAALRSALSALANAEAIPAPAAATPPGASPHVAGATPGVGAAEAQRRHVTDAEARRIIGAEISDRLSAAGQYDSAGHADRAARLRREAAVLTGAAAEPA